MSRNGSHANAEVVEAPGLSIRILAIVGPTACAKTRLGVEVAHALATDIVSVDSRQVYRGLDIGAGKDMDEYRRVSPPVRCHLVDIADPRSIYSVFHYQRDCYALLAAKARERRHRDGLPLLMVGGTGLYLEAVLRGYRMADVPEDPELRRRLMEHDRADLLRQLERLDPELARTTDLRSKKRVVRAIEIAQRARERPLRYCDPPPVRVEHAVFGVSVPREELHRRIDARLSARLEQGLIAEVEGLLADGVSPERMALLGLEYREVTAFLTGAKTEQQMVDDLRSGIHGLAKRQMTWFRGLPRRGIEVTWIAPDDRDALLGHPWAAPHRRDAGRGD